MENKFNLEIKEFGLINQANVGINKINVVGGINSSGKSTVSKLLYCYIRSIVENKRKYMLDTLYSEIEVLIEDIDTEKMNYEDVLEKYYIFRENYFKNTDPWDRGYEETSIHEIDYLIEIINNGDDSEIFSGMMKMLLSNESLSSGRFHRFYGNSFEICEDDNGKYVYKNSTYDNVDDFDEFPNSEHVSSLNDIKEIYYFDTVSIFEIESPFCNIEHISHLNENLRSKNEVSQELFTKIRSIEDKIRKIIHGNFAIRKNIMNSFAFVPSSGWDISLSSTSSGIKQIGAIQLLLHNNKLVPGTFLIIDEPEVNLHPEWQFKFAEILVILAKDLDITIYLNSHSPMFIESIDAFCEFYDMQDFANYYLTVPSHRYIPFNFKKIEHDELYKIYDNLGKPYDLIDQLRLKKHLGE